MSVEPFLPKPTHQTGSHTGELTLSSPLVPANEAFPNPRIEPSLQELTAIEQKPLLLPLPQIEQVISDELGSIESNQSTETELLRQYLADIRHKPLLSSQQELDLSRRKSAGDQTARQALIEGNLRLVISVAKRYVERGVSLVDLIGAGNIGLIIGIDKFDETQGFKISTYATWWIKNEILHTIENYGRPLRLTQTAVSEVGKFNGAKRMLAQTLGREPTRQELRSELHWSQDHIDEVEIWSQRTILSLDAPLGENEEETLGQQLEDKRPGAFTHVATAELKELVQKTLSTLLPEEQDVLALRYGLGNTTNAGMTQQEVADTLHLSQDRVRAIEGRAIRKLQNPTRRLTLQDYKN